MTSDTGRMKNTKQIWELNECTAQSQVARSRGRSRCHYTLPLCYRASFLQLIIILKEITLIFNIVQLRLNEGNKILNKIKTGVIKQSFPRDMGLILALPLISSKSFTKVI